MEHIYRILRLHLFFMPTSDIFCLYYITLAKKCVDFLLININYIINFSVYGNKCVFITNINTVHFYEIIPFSESIFFECRSTPSRKIVFSRIKTDFGGV